MHIASDIVLCEHCEGIATTEVTWREANEPTEDEPYTERTAYVCDLDAPVAVASAHSFYDLVDEPTVERFAPVVAAVAA